MLASDRLPAENGGESWTGIREAQEQWAALPVLSRLRVVRKFRSLLVRHSTGLAASCAQVRDVEPAEALTSELLPLAEACRFLETQAADILATRFPSLAGRPLWLGGVRSEVRRAPYGLVLILAPSNYPLFLAGVQLLHALVAGNAVLIKPAPGAADPLITVAKLLETAGLQARLLTFLPEDPAKVHDFIRDRVDKVVLTGGTAAGQAVLQTCGEAIIPATVELSGVDAFHVLADADTGRAADLLLYGLGLNRGRTCIAPRRVFVHQAVAPAMRQALKDRFRSRRAATTDISTWVREAVSSALNEGASIVAGAWSDNEEGLFRYPLILEGVAASSRLRNGDHFGPIAVFDEVSNEEEAIRLDRLCPFALGAAVFSRNAAHGAAFGARLPAPNVTVNDLIVPTADPRLPFGGRKRSGFGVTRGPEGLLEMTVPRVISRRPANSRLPHLDVPGQDDEERFRHLLNLLHGDGFFSRLGSLKFLVSKPSRKKNQA